MQSDREARIRERAYHIWVEEGRVHGKEHEHWQRAEREIATEDKSGAGSTRGRGRRPTAQEATPAVEAEPSPGASPRAKSTTRRRSPQQVT